MSIRVHSWFRLLAVLLVAAVAYAPGLFHGFVYDDHGTIVENTFLEKPANLSQVLTLRTLADPQVIDGQRPALLLVSFLDRAIWGLNPFGWHLTSLLLHLSCVALFYFLVSALAQLATPNPGEGGSPNRPVALSLLFALHPALSEAVQMPSYREDLLLVLFVLAYLLACARGRAGWSLPWLALALFSKESAAAAPALALALWGLFPATRPPRRAMILHVAAAVIIVAGFAWPDFRDRPLQALHVAWNGYSLRWPENLWRAPGLFAFYLRLLALPWPLCADRAVPVVNAVLGAAALIGTAWLALRWRTGRPLAALGLVWLLVAFVPVSNVLPLFNPVGERYLYLMAPGFLLAGAGLVSWGDHRCGAALRAALHPVHARSCVNVLLALAVITCFALVQLRLRDWRDDGTFWTAVLRVNPASARAHTWLGLEAKHRGDRAEAARLFIRAEQLNPQDVSALVNLAVLAGEAGDLAQAEAQLRQALTRRPDRPDVWRNFAHALRLQGRDAEADQAEAAGAERLPRW